jgi:hypothetical protein
MKAPVVVNLGWEMARIEQSPGHEGTFALTICSPDSGDDPAKCMSIVAEPEALEALAWAILGMVRPEDEGPDVPQ